MMQVYFKSIFKTQCIIAFAWHHSSEPFHVWCASSPVSRTTYISFYHSPCNIILQWPHYEIGTDLNSRARDSLVLRVAAAPVSCRNTDRGSESTQTDTLQQKFQAYGWKDGTQDPVHTRQVLCQWTIRKPYFSFISQCLTKFPSLPLNSPCTLSSGLALSLRSSYLASWGVWTAGPCHQTVLGWRASVNFKTLT